MLELGNSDSIILSATITAYNNLIKKNSTYQDRHLIQSHWGIVVTVISVYRPQASDWSILKEHNFKGLFSPIITFDYKKFTLERICSVEECLT